MIWIFVAICHALHNIGNHNNDPPDNGNGNGNGNNIIGVKANNGINNNLPTTTFSILDPSGTNTLASTILSQLFGGITNGTELTSNTDNIQIQTIGIGNYMGTNVQVINGNIVDWTGSTMLNFSILGSTNLCSWTTLCTILEWVNTVPPASSNPYAWATPTNVWICQAVYTNSVTVTNGVLTTNGALANVIWINLLPMQNEYGDYVVTNAIVYGTIQPVVNINNNAPSQFFRLYCNTNATDEQLTVGP
jgi:hypothetical protein